MNRRAFFPAFTMALALAGLTHSPASAQFVAFPLNAERTSDLADFVAGRYFGDVIHDSRGASRRNVSLTVTRIGKNRIQITSDYPRLPVVAVALKPAMHSIVQINGSIVFAIDRAKDWRRLDVGFYNEVRWSGSKR